MSRLLTLAGIIGVVAAARGLFTFADEYLLEESSQRVAYDLRNDFFNKLQGLSFGFHDRQQTGNLMSRATGDVEMVRTFAAAGFGHFLYLFLVLGTVAVLMFTMSWRLGLVSVLVIPLLVWRSVVTTPRMTQAFGKGFEEAGHMATVVQQSLAGIRVVKAFGASSFERAKFERRAAAVEAADVAATMVSISRTFLFWLSLNASLGAVLWVGLGRDGAADGRTAPAGLRHPPRRTGRAPFRASGSPSDGLDLCVGNIGFSAIFVGFVRPSSGVVRFVPHPSGCPPSPCGRLSRPRTTTRALPHVRHWPQAGLLRCRRAGRASQVHLGCVVAPS